MQNNFNFKDSGEELIANSQEEFITIFININNQGWLLEQLQAGTFEAWLLEIEARQLCELMVYVKNNDDIEDEQKIDVIIEQFYKAQIYKAQITQHTEINIAIETILKEYEVLRTEILFFMQNRTQIILLGLATIFTIGGLAITPLADFFTTENIEIPGALSIVITRYIDGKTINNSAILPSVFIFGLIIPMISLYVINRISDLTKQIITINYYITNNIEKNT